MKRIVVTLAALSLVAAGVAGGEVLREASTPAGRQGIGVHGDWVVTVKTRTGKVVTRKHFHNELTDNGQKMLRDLVHGAKVAGLWHVDLRGIECGPHGPCLISEIHPNPDGLGDLVVAGAPGDDGIILKGTTKPVSAVFGSGGISQVRTENSACDRARTPITCETERHPPILFTQQNVAVAASVGQLIQVTVTITFGTLTTPA